MPAFALHAAITLGPARRLRTVLMPMHDRCLIAPIGKMLHGAAMRAGRHERAHSRFVTPEAAGPERMVRFAQRQRSEIAGRRPRLRPGAERIPDQARDKAP